MKDHSDVPSQVVEHRFDGDFMDYRPEMLPENRGAVYELETNPGRKFENPFDLDNLKFYEKVDAEQLIRELEVLSYKKNQSGSNEKIVAVIGTGGTIAMTRDDSGELIPKLDTDTLLDELPASKRNMFKAASIQLPEMVDSTVMPPDVIADTALLMSAAWAQMSPELKENFAGFLVTHGTDTLAQSAALCRMMLGRSVPFNTGFVGAQKSVDNRRNDVAANIDGALSTLYDADEDQEASHHFVFMNGTSGAAMNSVGVAKISDTSIEGFSHPMHPALIDAASFGVQGLRRIAANLRSGSETPEFRPLIVRGDVNIEVLQATQGRSPSKDERAVKAAADDDDLEAIVLVTFGSFTYPPANFDAIKRVADEEDIPVFVANPFPTGTEHDEYTLAKRIKEKGAIPVKVMPAALVAKIHVAHAMFGDDKRGLKRFMSKDYVGETQGSLVL